MGVFVSPPPFPFPSFLCPLFMSFLRHGFIRCWLTLWYILEHILVCLFSLVGTLNNTRTLNKGCFFLVRLFYFFVDSYKFSCSKMVISTVRLQKICAISKRYRRVGRIYSDINYYSMLYLLEELCRLVTFTRTG